MLTIGSRIKLLREQRGLSMKALSDQIKIISNVKISSGQISDWENNNKNPSSDALIALSNFFNVSADWILKGDIPKENSHLIDPFIFFNDKWEVVSQFRDLDDYEKNFIVDCIKFAQYKKGRNNEATTKLQIEKKKKDWQIDDDCLKEEDESYTWLPWVGNSAAGDARDYYEVLSGYIPVPADSISGTCFIIKIEGDSMIGDGIMSGDFAVIKQQQTVEPNEIALLMIEEEGFTLKRLKRQGKTVFLIPSNPDLKEVTKPAKKVQIAGKYLYRIPGEVGLKLIQEEPK